MISFIVPLFNHLERTKAMLASLQGSLPSGLAYEVILADDASTDGTREWLAQLSDPRVKVLLNSESRGYARTNNTAVAQAGGSILGLLNNDLLLEAGWLEPMLEVLEAPERNAGIVANLQYRVADGALDHAGVTLAPMGHFVHLAGEPADPVTPYRVLAAAGACLLMQRDDYLAADGFDETYVNGGEDIDLCFRIRAARKAVWVAPTSRIRHHVSRSCSPTSTQKERNNQHLFARWRREIKFELTVLWTGLLSSGQYTSYLSGHLDPKSLTTPGITAWTIAESMLRRQEARWAR